MIQSCPEVSVVNVPAAPRAVNEAPIVASVIIIKLIN